MRKLEEKDLKLHDLCLGYLKGDLDLKEVVNFVENNYDLNDKDDIEIVYAIPMNFDGDVYDQDDIEDILDSVGFNFGYDDGEPGGFFVGDGDNPIWTEDDINFKEVFKNLKNIKRYNTSYSLEKIKPNDDYKKDKEFLKLYFTKDHYSLRTISKDNNSPDWENDIRGSLEDVKKARNNFKKLGYKMPGSIWIENKFNKIIGWDGEVYPEAAQKKELISTYKKYLKNKGDKITEDFDLKKPGKWIKYLIG